MSLIKRLAYYLGGFLIGIVLLLFFLNGKNASCDYTPNARVLKNIKTKPKHYSPQSLAFLNQQAIDTSYLSELLTNGDVDFKNSITHADTCNTYLIDHNYKQKTIRATIVNCDSLASIKKLNFKKK
ncbi:MAG: hypothetical protein ACTJGD_06460 [Mesonia hippocampi]|uniref:hypothetical protein n=1 Tax=Mesonia hippocampi TaxID=1628250 RepID=UPI003F95156E